MSKNDDIANEEHIAKWIPVLLDDKDWDHVFLFSIMKFKLELMEKYHLNDGNCEENGSLAGEMRVAIDLLDKLIKDDYYDIAHGIIMEKYGELRCTTEKQNSDGSVEVKLKYDKETDENGAELKSDVRSAGMLENDMRNNDLQKVFKFIADNVLGWWD